MTFSTDEIGDFVIVRPDGIAALQLRQRGRRRRDEDHPRRPCRGAPVEHLPPAPGLRGPGGSPCPPSPTCPTWPSRARRPRCRSGRSRSTKTRGCSSTFTSTSRSGYLPEAMMNYLARLGWSYDASQEIFSRAELIEKFTLDRVNSSPASHDQDKLFWIEGEWMKTLPHRPEGRGRAPVPRARGTGRRTGLGCRPGTDRGRGPGARRPAQGVLRHPQAGPVLLHEGADLRSRRREEAAPQGGGAGDARASWTPCWRQVEPYDLATLEKAVHDYAERTGRKMGDVVNPLRVATTGQGVGPGLYDCLFILGRATCRARIAQTLALLNPGPPSA